MVSVSTTIELIYCRPLIRAVWTRYLTKCNVRTLPNPCIVNVPHFDIFSSDVRNENRINHCLPQTPSPHYYPRSPGHVPHVFGPPICIIDNLDFHHGYARAFAVDWRHLSFTCFADKNGSNRTRKEQDRVLTRCSTSNMFRVILQQLRSSRVDLCQFSC